MSSWSEPAFDRTAFDNKRTNVVSAKTRISFADYDRIHVFRKAQFPVRRLPQPVWAQTDKSMADVILLHLEKRFYIHPNLEATNAERLAAIDVAARVKAAEKRKTLARMLIRFHEEAAGGLPEKQLNITREQIQILDSEIVLLEKGIAGAVTRVAYLYFRCGYTSPMCAEEIGAKPPMIRQWLRKLCFNAEGKPTSHKHGPSKV